VFAQVGRSAWPPEQLELFLLEDVVAVEYLPWGGRSPRELTKSLEQCIFEAGAGGRMSKLILARTSESHQSRGPVYDGAPLLLPLKRGV